MHDPIDNQPSRRLALIGLIGSLLTLLVGLTIIRAL